MKEKNVFKYIAILKMFLATPLQEIRVLHQTNTKHAVIQLQLRVTIAREREKYIKMKIWNLLKNGNIYSSAIRNQTKL